MNRLRLFFVVALLLIMIFSVLFFVGYFPKFELTVSQKRYMRSGYRLTTDSSNFVGENVKVTCTWGGVTYLTPMIYFKVSGSKSGILLDYVYLGQIFIDSPSYVTNGVNFVDIGTKNISISEYITVTFSWYGGSLYHDFVSFSTEILNATTLTGGTWRVSWTYESLGGGQFYFWYDSNTNFIDGFSYTIPPPNASFNYYPTNPNVVDNILFDASSSIGAIESYSWDFYMPNGTLYRSVIDNDAYINMTLPVEGSWTVKLTIVDFYNQMSQTSQIVNIRPYLLSVDFTWNPVNPSENSITSFKASYQSEYGVKSFSWNFGDGSFGSGQEVSHTYLNGGTYQVTVTVTDNNDKQASSTKQVNVLYVVKFIENGLPSGTSWKVVFNNVEKNSTENVITYTSNSGIFSYTVQSLDVKYVPSSSSGAITVPETKTLTITFTRQPLTDIEIIGPSSLPENTIGNYTLKPKIQNVVQPNYPIKIKIVKDGVQVDTKEVYSDESGVAVFSYGFTTGGTYSLDFYDSDLNVLVKSFTLTVKVSLTIISETQLTQTYDLSGEADFNAVFRVKATDYTSDFNIANLTLIDEIGNSIPYESYKEDYSIYVKAYLFKYYGTADDRDIRLALELSSNTYIGTSYSLTVKMTKPTIVVYMTDSSGQLIKSFVAGTNTFYVKFEAKGLNVNPSDVNITVINPEGVKSYISPYDIVPASTNIVKVTYTFEKTGTYVFVIELHGVVEMQPKTFTYSVNEPYNFFRYDNPFFVAVVVIAILVVYSLVKRKRKAD
jgi:hypothetical protein